MKNILSKWAKNENKLQKELKKLRKEVLILRKMPTPEDFEEQFALHENTGVKNG